MNHFETQYDKKSRNWQVNCSVFQSGLGVSSMVPLVVARLVVLSIPHSSRHWFYWIIYLCLLCMFALFLYISRQRGKSVNLLFISSRLLHEFDVVTFTAKRRLLVLALTTPRTHLSKHLVTSNTDTEDCFHSWMAGFLLIILAYCHVLDKFVRALLSWSPPLNQGNLYQVFD